jgi:hypothetical protein
MAFYNNWGDLTGDLKKIATGHNPMNNTNGPVSPQAFSNAPPGIPSGGQTLPVATMPGSAPPGLPAGFNEQAFEQQLQTNPDLAGVWDTIKNAGGDVWGTITQFLPKNADGSINWGAVGGDVIGWVKNNASTIVQGVGVYNAAQRQGQADKYAKDAYQQVQDRYAAKEPLRVAGMAGMLDPGKNTPDLTSLRTIAGPNSGNPFAPKTLPPAPGAAGALPVAGMPSGGGPPTPTVNGAPPGPVFMPGGDQTAPRPLPIQRPPQPGLIPRPGNGAVLQ